jgi:PAS domain S-box-containing protein
VAERKEIQLLKAAILQSNESILITDALLDEPGPRIVFTNAAFTAMTGYSAEEVRGRTPRLLQGPATDRAVLRRLRHALESGAAFEGSTVNYRKDGSEFVLEWKIAPIRDSANRVTHFVAVQRDITLRNVAALAANRLAAIVEHSDDAIIGKDLNGIVNSWNGGAERIFGFTAAEMVGTSITRIIPIDRLGEEKEILTRIRAGESVHHFETIRQAKDGRQINVSVTASPIRDAAGHILGASKSARDITARIRGEEAQRAAEAERIAFFEHAPDGILIADTQGRYLDANPSICRMLGYERSELIGMNATDIADPTELAEIAPAMETILSSGDYHRRWRFRRRDRSILLADVTATLLPDGNLMALFRDVTESRRAEEKIAEQAAFMDKARDAIIVRDLAGEILYWNGGAERIYGWTPAEAVGRDIALLAAEAPAAAEARQRALESGEWTGEMGHRSKDGRSIVVESRWTLIRSDSGDPKSILTINTDLTERKKIEAQFLRAQRMESIGTLAGGIAHDLNNILTPIMMSIGTLQEMVSDPEAERILETIEVCAKRGSDIVRQVLSFARGVDGERAEIQPKHLLNDISSIIRDTFPRNIVLDFHISTQTWTILGDPTQVHQILMNLCVNARDAMPNGGRLVLSAENQVIDEHFAAMNAEVKAGRYVEITVTDNGEGIPAGIIQKIFDPFFTTKEINKGTGLGLSTVTAIVKSHGGFINVYSEVGKGTTFRVYLPAAETSGHPLSDRAEVEALPRGKGETVLVVDDEASVVSITRQTLQAFGYRVLTAIDGADAVAVFLQNQDTIALIITDMMMPIMDGPAMIHAIRRVAKETKIIATSGLTANGDLPKVSTAGVRNFLTKPYTAGTLLREVRAVLDER